MSVYDQDTISDLLERWDNAKKNLATTEARIEKYKKLAKRIMVKNGTNIIESGSYSLNKQAISRNSIAKIDVPEEIWNRYSKSSSYEAFYLKKK